MKAEQHAGRVSSEGDAQNLARKYLARSEQRKDEDHDSTVEAGVDDGTGRARAGSGRIAEDPEHRTLRENQRLARLHPAARASDSEQNRRSPFEVLMRVRS